VHLHALPAIFHQKHAHAVTDVGRGAMDLNVHPRLNQGEKHQEALQHKSHGIAACHVGHCKVVVVGNE
jgi:hypothetical protein